MFVTAEILITEFVRDDEDHLRLASRSEVHAHATSGEQDGNNAVWFGEHRLLLQNFRFDSCRITMLHRLSVSAEKALSGGWRGRMEPAAPPESS